MSHFFCPDCANQPDHPCCSQTPEDPDVDRFLPVGDFVQPSLLENWVSALFAHFGKDPITFVLLKDIFFVGVITVLTLAWGFLGHTLGFISGFPVPGSRSFDGPETLSGPVTFRFENSDDWMEVIEAKMASNKDFVGVDRFVCCSDPSTDKGSTDDGSTDDGLTHEAEPKARNLKCYSEAINPVDCPSKDVYVVNLKDRTIQRSQDKFGNLSNKK